MNMQQSLPKVAISHSRMPNDQTSDLMVKRPYMAASGAVHLMGNLAPVRDHKRKEERKRHTELKPWNTNPS